MIAVLDRGVAVSGIYWRHESHRCLVALARRDYILAVSEAVLAENETTVRNVKADEKIAANPAPWLDFVRRRARRVLPTKFQDPVCRDPKGDMFLEYALAAGASHIVSRHANLLVLEKPCGAEVVTPRRFLAFLAARRKTK
jgi:predicted nucleic acid-binding protein